MKHNYFFLTIGALLLFTAGVTAQSVPIYATTQAATVGAEITSAANGPATFMGDKIVLAGTERYLDSIVVRVFNLASNAPFTLNMSLYSDCMSSSLGCGAGPGTLLAGSERTLTITPDVNIGTIFSVTFPYDGYDISSETDSEIAVMINASRNDVYWVLNETITTGAAPAGETPESVVIRCGSTVTLNNGCTRAFTNAINNFSMVVSASSQLGVRDNAFSDRFQVYPNPASSILNVESTDGSIQRLTLIDLSGRIVKQIDSNSTNESRVDLSDIASGNYLLRIQTNDALVTKKIVKN